MTQECRSIIEFIGCDHELYVDQAKPEPLLERYAQLRKEGQSAGFTPLFIIPSDTLAETLELFFEDYGVRVSHEGKERGRGMLLGKSKYIYAKDFLKNRLGESLELHRKQDLTGSFVDVDPCHGLNLTDPYGNVYPEVILAKVPTNQPWELAVWVPMGGFNDCPRPAEQAAVFRHWSEGYGAVPALVTYDTWELTIANPVTSSEDCEALAREHFAFSYDNVMQAGKPFNTILGLASCLRGSSVWRFWWD